MSKRFDGRTVIVTGGGRGIGKATARAFADEGADVLVVGRTEGELSSTVDEIVAAGGSGWARVCDIRDDAQVDAAVAAAMERWGKIDVLVNNAGVDDDTPFLEVDRARFRDVLDTNLTAAFVTAQAVAIEMAKAGRGVILHTASIDGSGGDGPFVAYNASKAGMLGLNRTMALELAEHGIRSNCVSPGFTHTLLQGADEAAGEDRGGGSGVRVPRLRRCLRHHRDRAAGGLRTHLELVHPGDAPGRLVDVR